MKQCRDWSCWALTKIEQDFQRSADTHLFKLDLKELNGVDIYLKDESIHPTGSLKHRLARSLFLYGICNGFITEKTLVVEASSGSTAVSEAYFAQLLHLPFIAVMPKETSIQKIESIKFYGGVCHFVDNPTDIYETAKRIAHEKNGHYMDQFTYAEQVVDWRGNNNIAESIFKQMEKERYPKPTWLVVGAGTGGTSATLGRYIRYRCLRTQLCVVDPPNSVFYPYYNSRDAGLRSNMRSDIEGIGRPRVEPSFLPSLIDRMICVPNEASYAGIRYLERWVGKKCGGSTGTNLFACLELAHEMQQQGQQGSIVSLICDPGERYLDTYYNDQWLAEKGYDISSFMERYEAFEKNGSWK